MKSNSDQLKLIAMLGLSCLPVSEGHFEGHYEEPGIFNLSQIDCLPITASHLKNNTSKDGVLSKVLRYMTSEWPDKKDIDKSLIPFWKCRDKISIEVGCLCGVS